MKFVIKKEDLYNGIKIVERATSAKALQPVLLNILIETIGTSAIKLVATDLDLTVIAEVDAQVEEEGKITLPSKTLNEIVSKLGDKLITFEMAEGETSVNITCQNSKFDIIGISASEFPGQYIFSIFCGTFGLNIFSKTLKHSLPLILTIAIPPTPIGVEIAQIVFSVIYPLITA